MTAAIWRAAVFGLAGVCMLGWWLVSGLLSDDSLGRFAWPAALAMLPCLVVSVLLTARLPGAAVTRVLAVFTLCALLSLDLDVVSGFGTQTLGSLHHPHMDGAVGVLASVLWLGTLPLIPLLSVVFPEGVPRRGWWRWVFIGQLMTLALAIPVLASEAIGGRSEVFLMAWGSLGVLLVMSGFTRTVYLVWLWWTSAGERRRQIFLFVVTAGVMALLYALGIVKLFVTGDPDLANTQLQTLYASLFACSLPTAIGVSVLRHRLFGIDITLNRLAVAAFLSLLLLGVYVVSTVIVSGIAGGGGLQWRPLVAAGVTVAALGPLYRLARSTVDRAMFGDRERPDRVLRDLASRLGETINPTQVAPAVVGAVAEALRLQFVALDRITPSGKVRSASVGPAPPATDQISAFPIVLSGQPLAEMLVTPRPGQASLSGADRALLTDLATQAGPALYASRLIDELSESRERLRLGRLEERETLRRALHDGISPTLAGIAIAAAAARAQDPTNAAVQVLLARIEQEAVRGSTTMRALLAGLRPPGLTELGLAAAVEQRATELGEATGVQFHVHNAEPMPPLNPDIEQTAYLIAVEAMVNVARHASAQHCSVTMAGHGDSLSVQVVDDGMGLTMAQVEGDGLHSARERVAASGGTLTITNNNGSGTRLEARLPSWVPS